MSKARTRPSTTARRRNRAEPGRRGRARAWRLRCHSGMDHAVGDGCPPRDRDRPHCLRRGRRSRRSGLGGRPGEAGSECHRHRQFRQRSERQDDRAAAGDRSRRAPPRGGTQSRQSRRHRPASPARGCGARARARASGRRRPCACRVRGRLRAAAPRRRSGRGDARRFPP